MLTSRYFLLFHFTFKSMIYLELIFVKSLRSVSRYFLHMNVQLSQHYLLEKLSFSHCVAFAPLSSKDQSTIFMGICFWSLYSVPLIYLSVLSPKTRQCLVCHNFILSLEIKQCQPPNFVLLQYYINCSVSFVSI